MHRNSGSSLASMSTLSISLPPPAMDTSSMTTNARLAALHDRVALTRESRVVCEKVLSRLQVLHRQLEHMMSMTASSTGSNGSNAGPMGKNHAAAQAEKAHNKISELLKLLEQFVDCDATRNIVLRLTDSRRFRQLQELHEELDAIFRMLRLEHVDPERQWRSEWAVDREDVEQLFQRALATREALFRELRTPDAQREALAVLRFAVQTIKPLLAPPRAGIRPGQPEATMTPEMKTAELIRSAFRKLVRMATVDIPVVPTWFISPAELSIENEPFAGGEHVQVFRASWGRFKTKAVVKRVMTQSQSQEASVYHKALIEEAELWSKFDHPSLLKMHGGFPIGSLPFLVVEYPANGSLDEYLATSSDPNRTTFRLLWQAANGLKYVHEQGVLCHDLKLSSIFVGSDGFVKIGQFASFFSKSLDGVVEAGASSGSIRWKAPELLRDSGELPSDASQAFAVDVYAFAMCILEALTGDLPWGWLSDSEVRVRVMNGELPERPEYLDDRVWSLIASMCDADPAKRPTMASVVQQLLVLAEDEERQLARGGARSSSMSSISVPEDLVDDEYDGQTRRRNQNVTSMSVDVDALLSARRNTTAAAIDDDEKPAPATTISVVTLHHKWLGVKINSVGNRIVVSKFLRSSSGALGEIEASGQVRLGDIIVAVNNRSVRGMNRHQIGKVIQDTPRPMQLMFLREADLLEESFQFHGLRTEERWRDRGSIVPMANGTELLFGSVHDLFTFSMWFSLSDSDDTFYGGVLLGAQDTSSDSQAWPYCHHQLLMVDPHGNLSSYFLQNETPVLIAPELQPNRWYHVAVVYNSRAVTVYFDGDIKHQANGVLYREWTKLSHVNIGSGCISRAPPAAKPTADFCGWYGFNGLVHEANVWHSELLETDVQQLFRGASDFVETPVYSLRRDVGKAFQGTHPPRRVMATRPLHVVAQTYN